MTSAAKTIRLSLALMSRPAGSHTGETRFQSALFSTALFAISLGPLFLSGHKYRQARYPLARRLARPPYQGATSGLRDRRATKPHLRAGEKYHAAEDSGRDRRGCALL